MDCVSSEEETQSITEAFTRQMEKTHAQYEKLLNVSHTQNLPSTLKVTSSTDGFRVMDPFDWTLDKNTYQRWQLWSHKARLAPSFPGKQFLQGKEKNMDTGTFTLGNIILNRHPALSTLTHPGRVQQNFQQLKMESSNMVALPCFNFNAEATPQMETSKKGPGATIGTTGKHYPPISKQTLTWTLTV